VKSFSVFLCMPEGVERSVEAVDSLVGLVMMAGTLAVPAGDTVLEVVMGSGMNQEVGEELVRSLLRCKSSW
jgi:hypothetical protein